MNNKKANPKLLTHELQIIKPAVKRLQNINFYVMILISVMLVGTFSFYPAISSLINDVIISSTGRIATATAPVAYKSEMRGVFVHCMSFGNPDWDLIAQTLADYKIDSIYGEFLSVQSAYYESAYVKHAGYPSRDMLAEALDACHSLGIKVHASMDVIYVPGSYQGDALKAWNSAQQPISWTCPTKAYGHLYNLTKELITKYPELDGFMFDYIRYDTADMCYCPECKAKFEAWLGEGPIDPWPGDFADMGTRQEEFMEWRVIPITDVVKNITETLRAYKPNIQISLAAWTYFSDCPVYWRKWIGQDTGDWIRKDYLDFVAPMMYSKKIYGTDDEAIQSYIDTDLKYMVGGPEGQIPLLAFLRTDYPTTDLTPEEFKAQIDYVRSRGLDGWIIWRYGGPGDGEGSSAPDIRNYLSVIDMPDTFALRDIQVSASDTEATITWTTDLPAASKVEYSTSPLFNASWELWRDFYYWDINHINGTVVEDNTPVTDHSITLKGLSLGTQYYFRVQSQDPSGTATSKVLTFTTES